MHYGPPLTDPEGLLPSRNMMTCQDNCMVSARRGERTDLTRLRCSEVWTQDGTAEGLTISRIAEAIEAQNLGLHLSPGIEN